jgi:hypothetical protein
MVHTHTAPSSKPRKTLFLRKTPSEGYPAGGPSRRRSAKERQSFTCTAAGSTLTQLTGKLFVSATYVGSEIAHLWDNVDLNPAVWLPGKPVIVTPSTPAQFGQCAALQANCGGSAENFRRLLELANPSAPNVNVYGSITSLDSGATQNYNGLLTNARWQVARNVNVLANWTWSHCIGLPATNISNLGAVYPHQPYQNNGPQEVD